MYFPNNLTFLNSIFLPSFDTEALNKILHNIPDDVSFENVFTNQTHNKICYGVQQLFTIGNFFQF